jgi:hypothetical protein
MLTTVVNSLITLVMSYAPLLVYLNPVELQKQDRKILDQASKQLQFTKRDSKKLLTVSQSQPAHQAQHQLPQHTETSCNWKSWKSTWMMTQNWEEQWEHVFWQSYRENHLPFTTMHVERNINLLARYGFFLWDQSMNLLSHMLDILAVTRRAMLSLACWTAQQVMYSAKETMS